MAYDKDMHSVLPGAAALIAPRTLTSAAASVGEFYVFAPVRVKRLCAIVTTAVVAGLTAPALQLVARPTPGSSTGQTVLGTVTIPTGAAVGQVVYKDITPFRVPAGYSLQVNHSVQATDAGSAAGAAQLFFECDWDPNTPANNSNMVASA